MNQLLLNNSRSLLPFTLPGVPMISGSLSPTSASMIQSALYASALSQERFGGPSNHLHDALRLSQLNEYQQMKLNSNNNNNNNESRLNSNDSENADKDGKNKPFNKLKSKKISNSSEIINKNDKKISAVVTENRCESDHRKKNLSSLILSPKCTDRNISKNLNLDDSHGQKECALNLTVNKVPENKFKLDYGGSNGHFSPKNLKYEHSATNSYSSPAVLKYKCVDQTPVTNGKAQEIPTSVSNGNGISVFNGKLDESSPIENGTNKNKVTTEINASITNGSSHKTSPINLSTNSVPQSDSQQKQIYWEGKFFLIIKNFRY